MVIKLAIIGRIRTYNKVTYTEKHGARTWKNRILKPKISKKDNYSRVELWEDGNHKTILVHRLVASTFLENMIDTKMTVNHIDGNKLNNRIDNLEWVSRADNIRYGFDNGQYSNSKKCDLIDVDGKRISFRSISKASEFLERNKGYISMCLKDNKRITNSKGIEYKVEIL